MWGGTFGIFPRVATAVGITYFVAAPASRRAQRWITAAYAAIGLVSAVSFFDLLGSPAADFADFDRLLDDAPEGRRVLGLTFDADLPRFALDNPLQHFPAHYVARKLGQAAVQFTDFISLPLHYKPGQRPPSPDKYFEWKPGDYDPHAEYARAFDLLIVRSGEPGEDPRNRIFGDDDGPTVRVRSHHGRWWLLEAGSVVFAIP